MLHGTAWFEGHEEVAWPAVTLAARVGHISALKACVAGLSKVVFSGLICMCACVLPVWYGDYKCYRLKFCESVFFL